MPSLAARALLNTRLGFSNFAGSSRLEIATNFIAQENRSLQDLIYLRNKFKSDRKKGVLAKAYLGYDNIIASGSFTKTYLNCDELLEAMFCIEGNYEISNIVKSWFCIEEQPNIISLNPHNRYIFRDERNREDLITMLPHIDDLTTKINIASSYIKKTSQDNSTATAEDFSYLVSILAQSETNYLYNTQEVAKFFIKCDLPYDEITKIADNLYPNNEFFRAQLFKDFVRELPINSLSNNQNLFQVASNFCESIKDDGLFFEVLKGVKSRFGSLFKLVDIMEISGNRLEKNHKSLSSALDYDLNEAVSEKYQGFLNSVISNDPSRLLDKKAFHIFAFFEVIKINESGRLDLFDDYHEVNLAQKLEPFFKIFKKDFIKKYQENFRLSDEICYLSKAERDKIAEVF